MTTERPITISFALAPQKGQSTGDAPPASGDAAPQGAPGTTAPGTPPQGAQGDACMSQMMWMLPLFVIFYFLLIRPQQKQEKARRKLIAEVEKGHRVVMNSGLHGTVMQLDETTVTLRVDKDVKLRFDRSAIQRTLGSEGSAEAS